MKYLRALILTGGLLLLWQILVSLSGVPAFILPGPWPVAKALFSHLPLLCNHLATTFTEILLGLMLGTLLGTSSALAMILSPLLKRWMLPILVISQAIPVFALAPVLVLWLGYGMASKVAMSRPWRVAARLCWSCSSASSTHSAKLRWAPMVAGARWAGG